MTQSVEDESTKPVYYESRVVSLHLDENALGRIDAVYKEFADQADEASVEKSKHDLGASMPSSTLLKPSTHCAATSWTITRTTAPTSWPARP